MQAVLLDAYGTLLDLPDPVPRLWAALRAAGHVHPPGRVAAALADEIAHYRVHHHRGRDVASLAELRLDCAAVLARGLGPDVPALPDLATMLVRSLRFVLFPDALPALAALRQSGVALAVVSNWDCSLTDVLADLGVRDRFAALSVSAVVGAAKPDPAIFHHALEALGVPAERAVHCGDLPAKDCLGARRAGLRAVLVDRAGGGSGGPCPRISSLLHLPAAAQI